MIKKLQPIFVILLLISILILIAIVSTGCSSPKLGKVIVHETICDDDCHNNMLDICGNSYQIVKLTAALNKNKILFHCQ